MGAEENGLTLEALAQRLETLERENTELRDEVSALRGSGTRRNGPAETRSLVPRREGQRASGFEGVVSRRALLSKAGAAAVAAVAAGTLLYPRQAKAHDATAGITPDHVVTHVVQADNHISNGPALSGLANSIWGAVEGENFGTGPGVRGWNSGFSPDAAGVLGINRGGEGVRGEGSTTAEVAGVRGLGKTGVWGSSSVGGYSGLYGQHTGSAGYGVVGDGTGSTGAGVVGRNSSGYGGQFEGGKAQLKLKPGGSAGKPTTGTHTKGEIYMDKAGALFVCTAGDGTTLGTWKKVNMQLV